MRRSAALIPILLISALLLTALPVAARSNIATGVADPAGGGPALADVKAAVWQHKQEVGKYPKLWVLWSKWGDRGGKTGCVKGYGSCYFPTESVKWLHSKGIIPVIWWVPTWPGNWEAGKYERYKRVLWGKHDYYIKTWARQLKKVSSKTKKPVIVRWAHESGGTWFPWSVSNFDNNKDNYKRAHRYIVKKFKGVGARKWTRFLWAQVTADKTLFPGESWIDFIGLTALNYGDDRDYWKDPKALIDMKSKAARKVTSKPLILAEVGSHYLGGDKASWLTSFYNRAYYGTKNIKGIVYLDTDHAHLAIGHPDWSLSQPGDGSAVAAYTKLQSKSRFRGTIK